MLPDQLLVLPDQLLVLLHLLLLVLLQEALLVLVLLLLGWLLVPLLQVLVPLLQVLVLQVLVLLRLPALPLIFATIVEYVVCLFCLTCQCWLLLLHTWFVQLLLDLVLRLLMLFYLRQF